MKIVSFFFSFFKILNKVKNGQLQTDSYNCQIKYFIFCEPFLLPQNTFLVNQL